MRVLRISRSALLFAAALALAGGCYSISPPQHASMGERSLSVTGYCKCGDCCGWERNWLLRPVNASGPQRGTRKAVGVTASGTRAKPGVISADTTRYPLGSVMYVPGYGYGRVEDRGSGVKGDHIEVYFNSHRQATAWGRQRLRVRVWSPEPAEDFARQ